MSSAHLRTRIVKAIGVSDLVPAFRLHLCLFPRVHRMRFFSLTRMALLTLLRLHLVYKKVPAVRSFPPDRCGGRHIEEQNAVAAAGLRQRSKRPGKRIAFRYVWGMERYRQTRICQYKRRKSGEYTFSDGALRSSYFSLSL